MSTTKTNAMRILDRLKVPYVSREYETDDGAIDGVSVAQKIGIPVERVYKTLVCVKDRELFVFIIPVAAHLDLKKAAKAAGVKNLDMLPSKELKPKTGYVHGGCTAIGMKKDFPAYIDRSAEGLELMNVSAGRIGAQIELSPADLARAAKATFEDLTAED